jgi:hypothetical protein
MIKWVLGVIYYYYTAIQLYRQEGHSFITTGGINLPLSQEPHYPT